MATTEQTINDALAGVLMETRSLWRYKGVVKSESVDVLKDSGKKPDILITELNVSPVIVETEILPAKIAQDAVRAEIDTRLATEVLGFSPELIAPDGPLALLRQKLALEPSITGAKQTSK